MKRARIMLLRLLCWIERIMHKDQSFSLNDPEWIALQNEVNSLKRSLNKQISGDKK